MPVPFKRAGRARHPPSKKFIPLQSSIRDFFFFSLSLDPTIVSTTIDASLYFFFLPFRDDDHLRDRPRSTVETVSGEIIGDGGGEA